MALFRIKKGTETKKATSPKVVVNETVKKVEKSAPVSVEKKTKSSDVLSLNYNKDVPAVLRSPRVTEKATIKSEKGVYVFNVAPRSTKVDVAEAIKSLYKVTPKKINMVSVPSKKVRVRGQQNKYGVKSGGKKAYVYLKNGDTIDIV